MRCEGCVEELTLLQQSYFAAKLVGVIWLYWPTLVFPSILTMGRKYKAFL